MKIILNYTVQIANCLPHHALPSFIARSQFCLQWQRAQLEVTFLSFPGSCVPTWLNSFQWDVIKTLGGTAGMVPWEHGWPLVIYHGWSFNSHLGTWGALTDEMFHDGAETKKKLDLLVTNSPVLKAWHLISFTWEGKNLSVGTIVISLMCGHILLKPLFFFPPSTTILDLMY